MHYKYSHYCNKVAFLRNSTLLSSLKTVYFYFSRFLVLYLYFAVFPQPAYVYFFLSVTNLALLKLLLKNVALNIT